MRVVFMGTPDFAVGALNAIIQAGHEVALIVTQPDKPKGRGKEMQFPPVKECGIKAGIPIFQPVKIKTPEAIATLKQCEADIFVVAAFGQLLSKEILEMPRFGCINIHASLLPKYRGAAPIQWAIINGEKETGVTIMQMDTGLDTGDMLMKKHVSITARETGESLHDKLMAAGAELITEALTKIEKGEIQPEKQPEECPFYAKMLTKQLGEIHWEDSARRIESLIRGLNSWPSAYTYYKGKTLKIWEAEVLSKTSGEIFNGTASPCGTVGSVGKDCFSVVTGDGMLMVKQVQLEGKKKMSVHDFLLGNQMEPGVILKA